MGIEVMIQHFKSGTWSFRTSSELWLRPTVSCAGCCLTYKVWNRYHNGDLHFSPISWIHRLGLGLGTPKQFVIHVHVYRAWSFNCTFQAVIHLSLMPMYVSSLFTSKGHTCTLTQVEPCHIGRSAMLSCRRCGSCGLAPGHSHPAYCSHFSAWNSEKKNWEWPGGWGWNSWGSRCLPWVDLGEVWLVSL